MLGLKKHTLVLVSAWRRGYVMNGTADWSVELVLTFHCNDLVHILTSSYRVSFSAEGKFPPTASKLLDAGHQKAHICFCFNQKYHLKHIWYNIKHFLRIIPQDSTNWCYHTYYFNSIKFDCQLSFPPKVLLDEINTKYMLLHA